MPFAMRYSSCQSSGHAPNGSPLIPPSEVESSSGRIEASVSSSLAGGEPARECGCALCLSKLASTRPSVEGVVLAGLLLFMLLLLLLLKVAGRLSGAPEAPLVLFARSASMRKEIEIPRCSNEVLQSN